MSDINTSLERIEDPVPVVVIKTEIDNNGEINNDSKTKSKSDCELPSKTQHCSFLCSICQKNYTDQKFFYEHLESHYVPASPDYFECFVCQGTYASQVDFYTHSREHYKPSLVSELPNSVTGDTFLFFYICRAIGIIKILLKAKFLSSTKFIGSFSCLNKEISKSRPAHCQLSHTT
jgi:hypothetical protein